MNSISTKKKLFLASPMSGLRKEEYTRHRDRCLMLKSILSQKYEVYFAGDNIETTNSFDKPEVALKLDWKALSESQICFLYYPDRIHSSVLIEIGAALAWKIPTLCFVRSVKDLPFLVRCAQSVSNTDLLNSVEIIRHNWGNQAEILNLLKTSTILDFS